MVSIYMEFWDIKDETRVLFMTRVSDVLAMQCYALVAWINKMCFCFCRIFLITQPMMLRRVADGAI